MNELALFAGAGGGILGGRLLGWRTVCAVERNEYAASVLVARQNDGILEAFPIWSDVCTFDGKPWRGCVDVVSGGFPCQDISSAGKGAGIEGDRSGLWVEMARIIGEVQPRYVLVENSPILTSRGLGRVLGDLASMGYDAEWGVLGAWHVGAPHKRDRIWIVACNSNGNGKSVKSINYEALRVQKLGSDASGERLQGLQSRQWEQEVNESRGVGTEVSNPSLRRHRPSKEQVQPRGDGVVLCDWWEAEPELGRVANGVARRVDRLRAIGNGQVPQVAALAWARLKARLEEAYE